MEVTIKLNDIELVVTGYYTAGEKRVMYYKDGSGYPGSSPEFEIEKVECGGVDITGLLDVLKEGDVEDLVIDEIEDNSF